MVLLRGFLTLALAEGKYGARARAGPVPGLTSESRLKAIADEGAAEPWTSRQVLDTAAVLHYDVSERIGVQHWQADTYYHHYS